MEERIITEIKREPFIDNDGLKWEKVTYEVKTPRRTYIYGYIRGKYRGNFLKISDEYYNADFYDFEVYEALVEIKKISTNKPFDKECNNNRFPREKLPELLKVHVNQSGEYFELGIIEPKICDFNSDKKLHQTEGNEIFGTFTGDITGYILDYEISYYADDIKVHEIVLITTSPPSTDYCISNGVKTGRKEEKENYIRYEYYCKKHTDTIWGKWEKKNQLVSSPNGIFEGCFSFILSILGILVIGAILINFLPALLYIIGFGILIWLLNLFAPFLKGIVRGLIGLFFIGLLISLVYNFSNRRNNYIPNPTPVESERELNPIVEPITDVPLDNNNDTPEVINDKLVKHFRNWSDYDGNQYEGTYYIKQSNYIKSGQFKKQLSYRRNISYDQMLYNLNQFDSKNFSNLYNMLDSIGNANKLNKIDFAKMVVSFVQDIPYNLVLQNDCDSAYQTDSFTRNFLINNQGMCIGNQEFGICSPVEFLYHLKGDCDTRTLLLYSILNHYNYDVAILSSEKYMHSILGINLPLNGVAYQLNNKKYYFWETTAIGAEPGQLSKDFKNIYFWRISLKSK